MRRKSKKTKEETTTTERRSKRASTRRKRAYEDEEGGSDVEEEKVVEEEMTPAKSRGGRRYATRGRRQKAEESEEEEASQGEEEQEEEDENSNSVAVVAESASVDNEVAEECISLKSGIAVSDKSIVSEGGDGASAWKSDKPNWGMKSNKDSQDDRGEETPAQGEGDDGEEEGSRSHSRKRKLKLSRECLQESREAIPKIRLRLSRNRSGGYETEKLEAERIETKKSEEASLVKVIKVKTVFEEKEPEEKEDVVIKDTAESEGKTEQIVCEGKPAEATEEDTKEVAAEEQVEEEQVPEVQKEEPEEVTCKEDIEEVSAKESEEEEKVEVTKSEHEKSEEVSSEKVESKPESPEVEDKREQEAEGESEQEVEEVKEQEVEEVKEQEVEEVKEQEVEEVKEQEVEEVKVQVEEKREVEKERIQEVEKEAEVEEGGEPEVEEEVEEKKVEAGESREEVEEEAKVAEKSEEEESQQESSKEASPSIPESAEENLDEASSMEEKEQKSEVDGNVEPKNLIPAAKEKEDVEEKCEEQEIQSKRQEAPVDQIDEGKDEEPREKQVSAADEVSDQPIVEEDKEAEESDSEKQKDDEREGSEAEEGRVEKIAEVNKDAEEVVDKKTEEVKESVEGVRDCVEEKEPIAEVSEVILESTKEQESRHESGERVSRISRPKLRQDEDEDDAVEELPNQKRRRRRRSRSGESSGEQRRLSTTSETSSQPKRVTLKRPRLIRNVSSSSMKDTIVEEKPEKEEPESKIEEEKEEISEPVTPAKEITPQEGKAEEESVEDGMRKRRRKWGQQKSVSGPSQSKRAFISISTQSLKGLIPEVKPLPIHELRLSVEKDEPKDICIEEEESCEVSMDETIVRMIDANGQNERTVWAQVVEEERTSVHTEINRVPVVGSDGPPSSAPIRRISIVSDDATRLQRSPSPPRHPPSNVLFLSNLVRPFTVQQLKELLARTGTVVEDGFWIDRIKSMCLVQYETEEQARETRHALHGVRWPISNPKRLFVDFSTKERLEEAKREGNVPTPVPATAAAPSLSPPHTAPRDDFPRKTEPLRVDGSGMMPVHHPVHRGAPGSPNRQAHAMIRQPGAMMAGEAEAVSADWQQRNRPRPDAPVRPGANTREYKLSAPVREWDLDKVVQQSPPGAGMHGPNRVDERRRPEAAGQPTGRRMLPSPPPSMQEIQARKAKRKEAEAAAAAAAEAPANLLDSLFRKTKATPSIYWLPLTAEQIKVKEEIRRQHLAEHERRIAEMKRAADRGSRRRRRSSTPRRRSRRRSGEGSSAAHKKSTESLKGHKASSASPKK